MNNRIIIAVVIVIGIAAGGFYFWQRSSMPEPQVTKIEQPETAPTVPDDVDLSRVIDMSLGNPDAAVTVIEYASFTCPHCRNFHDTVYGDLKANYIDTGKIHFIYREVYFDKFGLWAGMVARCAGPLRYFGISDMLYDRQTEWLASHDEATIAEELKKIGLAAGLGAEQLDACMQDDGMARALVATYQLNAQADDINSTPSFVINGTKYSNMNYADFSALLDEKLGG